MQYLFQCRHRSQPIANSTLTENQKVIPVELDPPKNTFSHCLHWGERINTSGKRIRHVSIGKVEHSRSQFIQMSTWQYKMLNWKIKARTITASNSLSFLTQTKTDWNVMPKNPCVVKTKKCKISSNKLNKKCSKPVHCRIHVIAITFIIIYDDDDLTKKIKSWRDRNVPCGWIKKKTNSTLISFIASV